VDDSIHRSSISPTIKPGEPGEPRTPGQPGGPVRVSVLIPCFNEQDALPQLSRKLVPVLDTLTARYGGAESCELILIDDGSTDGTLAGLREALGSDPRVRIVAHERNQGLGAALRTGFAAARGELIVTTDADGTYDFAEIPGMLQRLQPGVDVVTASPYHPEGGVEGVPPYRLILSQGASLIYRTLLDASIYCYTAMFRAYRRQVLQDVAFTAPGYLAMAEILAEAVLRGYRVVEYPTVLTVRRYGQSKAKVAKILREHVRFQLRILPRAARHRLRQLSGTNAQS